MAVTETGKAYVWGCSFRNEGEVVAVPHLLFHDKNGIEDVQLGRNHGAYVQSRTSRMFTWGDHSFGQTGNNYKDDCEPFCEDKPRDHLDPNYDPANDQVPLHPLFKGRTWNKGLTLRSSPKAEDPEIGK